MENAITVKDLNVKLNGFELKDINLEIPKGVVAGLIGRNGAGKTTLINALTDIYIPEGGSIMYGDYELAREPEKAKAGFGVCYDSLFYPPNYKAEKIVRLVAPFYADFDMDKWESLMDRFGLDKRKKVGQYSKGMQMKFMLTMVFARDPKVLILDACVIIGLNQRKPYKSRVAGLSPIILDRKIGTLTLPDDYLCSAA